MKGSSIEFQNGSVIIHVETKPEHVLRGMSVSLGVGFYDEQWEGEMQNESIIRHLQRWETSRT